MTTEYQISTPRFTCWLQVTDGVITKTAPYLRHLCLGKQWEPIRGALQLLTGARLYRFDDDKGICVPRFVPKEKIL